MPAIGATDPADPTSSPPPVTTMTTMTSMGGGGGGGGHDGSKNISTAQTGSRENAFYNFFWSVLYLTPMAWCILFLLAVVWLKFQCLVTLMCALVLSAANVYGYYKCSTDQRERWSSWMTTGARMSAVVRNSNTVGRIFGLFGGMGNTNGGRQQLPRSMS